MSKIYCTCGSDSREGWNKIRPDDLDKLESESIDEFHGQGVLEKVDFLSYFMEQLYGKTKPDSKIILVSAYFSSSLAYESPLTKRAISEMSINFASKSWREKVAWDEGIPVHCDFDIAVGFSISEADTLRAEEVKAFGMRSYTNYVQAVQFNLTKK